MTYLKLKQIDYRGIAYFCSLLYIGGSLIYFSNPVNPSVYTIGYGIIALFAFSSTYLWRGRVILLIGLLLYAIDFNISLQLKSETIDRGFSVLPLSLNNLGILFHIGGFICLIFGLWDKPNKLHAKGSQLRLLSTLIAVLLLTGLLQTGVMLLGIV